MLLTKGQTHSSMEQNGEPEPHKYSQLTFAKGNLTEMLLFLTYGVGTTGCPEAKTWT